MASALRQVQSKLGTSLAAPDRPLFDFGVGLNAEFDTAELSMVVRLPALTVRRRRRKIRLFLYP